MINDQDDHHANLIATDPSPGLQLRTQLIGDKQIKHLPRAQQRARIGAHLLILAFAGMTGGIGGFVGDVEERTLLTTEEELLNFVIPYMCFVIVVGVFYYPMCHTLSNTMFSVQNVQLHEP